MRSRMIKGLRHDNVRPMAIGSAVDVRVVIVLRGPEAFDQMRVRQQ